MAVLCLCLWENHVWFNSFSVLLFKYLSILVVSWPMIIKTDSENNTVGFKQWCKLLLHAKPPWRFVLHLTSAFSRESHRRSLLHVVMLMWSFRSHCETIPGATLDAKLGRNPLSYGLRAPEAKRRDFCSTCLNEEPEHWWQEVDFHVNRMASQFEKGFLHSGYRTVCESGLMADTVVNRLSTTPLAFKPSFMYSALF